MPSTNPRPPAAAAANPSFLDDWLNKRRTNAPPPRSAGPSPANKTPTGQPTPKAAQKPSPATQPASSTKNISSDELDHSEVDKIAAELRQELSGPKASAQQPAKTESTITLKADSDDTIFIDQDGAFQQTKQEEKK
jgi:hypothetical protein